MSLVSGARLGPYEIVGALGAGGMGEVYRARDTRLGRDVAVKVLPPRFASDAEMKQRFEREAKAISALSHPHICALHDVGSHDGSEYLVMEFLEGQTLADRLLKGPLPLEQVLRIGIEIATALEAAHRQDIAHRDLKPGNVMITKSGVKLLDFGLAKAIPPAGPVAGLTSLPTMAGRQNLTQEGTILGTFHYMAPEQLEGKDADARTDIFALGVVLYEMVTGRRAFEGKSQASLISAIMQGEPPPLSSLQPMTPPALDRLVRTCLAKDPDDRLQSAHDVAAQLKWIAEGGSQVGIPAPVVSRRRSRERLAWLLVAAFAAASAALSLFLMRPPPTVPLLRTVISLPPKMALEPLNTALALSPDGRRLALAASGPDGNRMLWVRPMDSLEVQPLTGTEGATCPFWSPDSRFIGFFADRKLKKVLAAGGTVLTICDAPDGRGASWSEDDVIVFAPGPFSGLFRVSASGGASVAVTRMDALGSTHRLPWFLPDGKHLLFLSGSNRIGSKDNGIWLLDLNSGKTALFAHENSEGRYVEAGYLVFVRDGNLMAQPMDASRLKLTGEAVPIAERISFLQVRWSGGFSFSKDGLLVVQPGAPGRKRQLTWFDLDGKSLGTVGEPAAVANVSIAPDGRRAAGTIVGPTSSSFDIWMYDLARGVGGPFTFGNDSTFGPQWSPDGRLVVYSRLDGSILSKPADGSAEAKTLASGLPNAEATSWSPDGRFVALRYQDPKSGGFQVWMVPVEPDKKAYPFLAGPAQEQEGAFSPDGRWLAYISDESGRPEVYVTPFPGPGEKRQISTGGAAVNSLYTHACFWLDGGRRLAYLSPEGKLVAVDFDARGSALEVGGSHVLFGGRPVPDGPFDVTPDGKRLLVAAAADDVVSTQLVLVTNWTAALAKK